jgi:ABC-type oligopeptide transport system ATPase subunit
MIEEKQLSWPEIINNARKGMVPPELAVIAGGSGTGKTSLARNMINQEIIRPGVVLIDPDLISRLYLEMRSDLERHPEMDANHRETYYVIRDAMVMECLKRGIDVVLLDHGHNYSAIEALMKKAASPDTSPVVLSNVPPYPPVYTPPRTGLVGIFLDEEGYIRMFKSLKITRQDMSDPDFKFMMASARGFAKNFKKLTTLFDTSLVFQNLYTSLENVLIFNKEEPEFGNFIDKKRYKEFRFNKYDEVILKAFEIALSENQEATQDRGKSIISAENQEQNLPENMVDRPLVDRLRELRKLNLSHRKER